MPLEEYEELDKIRKEAGEKSRAHYKSLDLPGSRNKNADVAAARQRIADMKKEKEKPNHE